jgi:hypothetical protein
MAKKKLDPKIQQWMESFNREPTLAEEEDFYKRNEGGPIATYPSLTRGRGALGYIGQYDQHLLPYWSDLRRRNPRGWPPWTREDHRLGCEAQNAADEAWRMKLKRSALRRST